MREHKFRGKNVDDGDWEYGSLVHHTSFRPVACSIDNGIFALLVIPETVGEFTGMPIGGQDSYEGDRVGFFKENIETEEEELFATAVILYKEDEACYYLKFDGDGLGKVFDEYELEIDCSDSDMGGEIPMGYAFSYIENSRAYRVDGLSEKIIGNIHDNPEQVSQK